MALQHDVHRLRRVFLLLTAAALAVLACAPGAGVAAQATPTPTPEPPTGVFLTPDEVAAFAAEFDDNPLVGGQVAPRLSKWVTDDIFLFLQFDNPNPAEATALRYIGIGVKGVFCAEDQPDRSFTHFHRYDAPEYGEGHGGDPGAQGYWLTWAAVDTFEARDGRKIAPGIDYDFSPTPPPSCGADVPEPDFTPVGAHRLNPEEVTQFAALFSDPTLTGGQTPPRLGKWVNEQNFIFVQLDNPEEPTAVRYFGVGSVGAFCAEAQPATDFTHYHRFHAAEYREGHAGEPGEEDGFWLLWIAADSFEARDRRKIAPGVDREFSPTPPPACGDAPVGTPVAGTGSLAVTASEWRFDPAILRVEAGAPVTLTVTNTGAQLHTLTVPRLRVDTGTIEPGAAATLTFTAPTGRGSYDVICTFPGHEEAGMIGSLVVE
jgi:plastocyanin